MKRLSKEEKISQNIKQIKSRAVPILKKYNAKKAAIFGSYARGENKRGSDIDLLVDLVKPKKFSLFDFVGIKLELEEALGKKVDLVEYHLIKPIIKEDILSSKIEIL